MRALVSLPKKNSPEKEESTLFLLPRFMHMVVRNAPDKFGASSSTGMD